MFIADVSKENCESINRLKVHALPTKPPNKQRLQVDDHVIDNNCLSQFSSSAMLSPQLIARYHREHGEPDSVASKRGDVIKIRERGRTVGGVPQFTGFDTYVFLPPGPKTERTLALSMEAPFAATEGDVTGISNVQSPRRRDQNNTLRKKKKTWWWWRWFW